MDRANAYETKRYFSPSIRSSVLTQRLNAWGKLKDASEEFSRRTKELKTMDNCGCADRWPIYVVEAIVSVFSILGVLCDDIDRRVGQKYQGESDRGSGEDVLGGDLVVSLLVDLLRQRIKEVTEAQIDSGELRGVLFAALGNAVEFEVNSDGEGSSDG